MMMNEKRKIRTSKFLSMVLRHKPHEGHVTMDSAGWVDVDALLAGCTKTGRAISRSELEEVIATNDKKRFEFNEDGTQIRASQGHSVEVDLE
jgi:putative RNA 2'-phosphotransferase